MQLQSVAGGERHLLRRHHVPQGKIGGNRPGSRSRTAVPTRIAGCIGCCASAFRNATALESLSGAGRHSIPCPVVSATGVPPLDRHLPQMPPVDIALVGGEDHFAPARRERHIFHFECPRCEQRRLAARGGDCIEVRPAIGFPGKDDAAAVGPQQLIARRHTAEHASRALRRAPDLAPRAGLRRWRCEWTRARPRGALRAARAIRSKAREGMRCCARRATIRARDRHRCWGPDSEASSPPHRTLR